MKPKKAQPDHAYNIPRLNKIFFWSSLAALLSIVWWVVDVDYDKPWKRYQREFRSLSAEKVQTMLEREQNRLGRGRRKQQLDELQAQLTTAQDGLRRKRVEQEEARARLGDAEKPRAPKSRALISQRPFPGSRIRPSATGPRDRE